MKETVYKYFEGCRTIEEIQELYRKKAKEFHPDRQGDHEKMVRLNDEYSALMNNKYSLLFPIGLASSHHRSSQFKNNTEKEDTLLGLQKLKELENDLQITKASKGSIYFNYRDFCKMSGVPITEECLFRIAAFCNYQKGWVHHKKVELLEQFRGKDIVKYLDTK